MNSMIFINAKNKVFFFNNDNERENFFGKFRLISIVEPIVYYRKASSGSKFFRLLWASLVLNAVFINYRGKNLNIDTSLKKYFLP